MIWINLLQLIRKTPTWASLPFLRCFILFLNFATASTDARPVFWCSSSSSSILVLSRFVGAFSGHFLLSQKLLKFWKILKFPKIAKKTLKTYRKNFKKFSKIKKVKKNEQKIITRPKWKTRGVGFSMGRFHFSSNWSRVSLAVSRIRFVMLKV